MKVALVLHGQMRDFHKCIKSWETFINLHQPDIFAHTWEAAQPIHFKPKGFLVETPLDFTEYQNGVTEYGSSALNVLPQMHSMYKANELKINYENFHHFKYDWVLRARFDISLHTPGAIQFSQMSPHMIHVCANHWGHVPEMFDDNIMVMAGQHDYISGVLFGVTQDYIMHKRVIPSGEQLLSYYLNKNFKDHVFKNHDLNFTLGRQI